MDPRVALEHIGGGRALVMIGGKAELRQDELTVKFKAAAKDRINAFVVTLSAADLYTVRFVSIRAGKARDVETVDDLFAENLKPTIERRLGLYLSL